jgi:hypothetical protein
MQRGSSLRCAALRLGRGKQSRSKSSAARWELHRSADREAVFHPEFRQDLRSWIETDRKVALRAVELMESILRDPFTGSENPNR